MFDFSATTRMRSLERAADSVADLVVVGGGITGAGIARDAALRGYRVVLLDRGDFASGTSSRSSKLIHGGVRYLQQGDLGLVKEAARERSVLRRIAPHLATPARMLVPAASKGARLKLGAGMWTFEKLAGPEAEERHESFDRAGTLGIEPRLRSERLSGAVSFTEYITNDARLTLENLQSAARAGADIINYAIARKAELDGSGVKIEIEDLERGERAVIRARCAVNAAGPWFEHVRDSGVGATDQVGAPRVQLTRGIHLVVPRERFPISSIVVMRAPDGRSAFVVPSGPYAYIGTTDTNYEGDPSEPGITTEDVDYLLAAASATFEDAPGSEDIIGTWSGVRPLLRQDGKKPSEISRRDEIHVGPGPFVSIVGGKLTTYRRMAERVVDKVRDILGDQPAESDTAGQALTGGSEGDQQSARQRSPRLDDSELETRLWVTYGAVAEQLVARIAQKPELGEPLEGLDALCRAEIEHCVDHEMVLTLDDLLRRRSHVAMFDTPSSMAGASAAAQILAGRLGWDADRVRGEVEAFTRARTAELSAARHESEHPSGTESK